MYKLSIILFFLVGISLDGYTQNRIDRQGAVTYGNHTTPGHDNNHPGGKPGNGHGNGNGHDKHDPSIPIDNGIEFLILAGTILVFYTQRKRFISTE